MKQSCPCCSGIDFEQCCAPLLSGAKSAQTPEQLMRSRYSAFACNNMDYVQQTMAEKALKDADMSSTGEWASNCQWTGLEVIASQVEPSGDSGQVSFIASFIENGKQHQLRENSLFKKIDNKWFYIGSVEENTQPVLNEVKVGRNDPCPCGSQKKYKKCCLRRSA